MAHYVHIDCWNAQPEHMKTQCQMCKQPEVSEQVLSAICASVGVYTEEIEVMQQLPEEGQNLVRHFLNRDRR